MNIVTANDASKLKPQKEGDVKPSQHSHARSKALSVNANDRDAAARPRALFLPSRDSTAPRKMAPSTTFSALLGHGHGVISGAFKVITCPGQENWNANPLVN